MRTDWLNCMIAVWLACPALAAHAAPVPAPVTTAAKKEIRVNLFGQPCALTGPVSEAALAAVHAVSPEQVPPDPDTKTAKASLDRLRESTDMPPALDNYRSRLLLRIEAQSAFFDEFEKSRKSGKPDSLLALARKHASAHRKAALEGVIRSKATPARLRSKSPTALRTELYEAFNDAIEPHPEEEFHRAIRQVDIAYVCTFDDAGDGDASDSEENAE